MLFLSLSSITWLYWTDKQKYVYINFYVQFLVQVLLKYHIWLWNYEKIREPKAKKISYWQIFASNSS